MHMHAFSVPAVALTACRSSRKIAVQVSSLLTLALASVTLAQTSSIGAAPSYEPYADTFHHGVPAWSPGDREIIYSEIYTRRTAGHLLRVASSGGKSTPLFPGESFTIAAAWSPDGKHIAFSRETQDGTHIWISDARGKELHELPHSEDGPDLTPAWSPDGSRIAYNSVKGASPQLMAVPARASARDLDRASLPTAVRFLTRHAFRGGGFHSMLSTSSRSAVGSLGC